MLKPSRQYTAHLGLYEGQRLPRLDRPFCLFIHWISFLTGIIVVIPLFRLAIARNLALAPDLPRLFGGPLLLGLLLPWRTVLIGGIDIALFLPLLPLLCRQGFPFRLLCFTLIKLFTPFGSFFLSFSPLFSQLGRFRLNFSASRSLSHVSLTFDRQGHL